MNKDIIISIIGIIGTLGGTVLGWFLNNLSQKGNLCIYIKEWIDKLEYNKEGYMTQSHSFEETQLYSYKVSLDLYNSSRDTRIMRNIKIVFMNKKKSYWSNIPEDDSTRRSSGPISFYENATVINIPPKTVLNVNLHGGIWKDTKSSSDNLDFLQKSDRVVLKYTNEKNREKEILIKKENYVDYFTNHTFQDAE